jgi:[ribosomal protein S18]-alanine N-acetyltransferase
VSLPGKTLKLQLLNLEALDQLVELDRVCFGKLWSRDQYQRELESPNSDIIGLMQAGQLLAYGCVWAIVDEAHVTIIAVHPDRQNQGFGTLMLYGLMQSAINRQLARATLEVRVSNQTAIGLYEKFGFETLGRRKKYYADTGEDALILWKNRIQASEYQLQLDSFSQNAYQKLHRQGLDLIVSLDTELSPNLPLTVES